MLWVQAVISFAGWISLGVWMARRSAGLRSDYAKMSRISKALGAGARLLFGAAILLVGFALIGPLGFRTEGLSGLAWVVLTLAGFGFVYLQTLAFAMVVSIVQEDAAAGRKPSSGQEDVEEVQ